uniref:Uncharacterized protein n=1 Tax=Rhizophora mucronata TaxID=61149 RepID=A0A2P2QIF5_RHIMU
MFECVCYSWIYVCQIVIILWRITSDLI